MLFKFEASSSPILAVLLAKFEAVSAIFNEILDKFSTFIVTTIAVIDKLLNNIILLFIIRIDVVFLTGENNHLKSSYISLYRMKPVQNK